MTIARKDIVASGVERAYHCTVRCVRQSYLCGRDAQTGCNYEHRRNWIKDRLRSLSGLFAVDIIGYAVMNTHIHVISRILPSKSEAWTEEEVAHRWLTLYPPRAREGELPKQAHERKLANLLVDPERVALLRSRLASLSWFMRCLNEHIARKANREDRCKGRFWEGRFKCQGLLDEAAILACLTYVDLNPIRAGMATTPEESDYTSAQDRIVARLAGMKMTRIGSEKALPMVNSEGAISKDGSCKESSPENTLVAQVQAEQQADVWLCPISDQSDRVGVFRALTLSEYLDLLDATGRIVRSDKRGVIPSELAPILARLDVNTVRWAETIHQYKRLFRRMVGRAAAVAEAARTAGRRWFQGTRACNSVFRPVAC